MNSLLKQFNIKPKNYAIYEEAFTHSSYAHDTRQTIDYEKLEFLGDAVIELLVSEHLYKKYKDMDEGALSKARIVIVQSKTLVKAAKVLNLERMIKIGDSLRGLNQISDNILEDVFEAFIGAVYLDQGLIKCQTILKQTIIHLYEIHSLNENLDYKSMLQEYAQKFPKHSITYKLVHNVNGDYWSEVYVNSKKSGIGHGSKIKDAEMQAAKDAYKKLVKGR
ncbi:MAG: ribonuclease III [Mycoplasmataceae bacterium]|jgi:ribonuclease-3|nr:ribonuclease III [Mycoplasmataceae bacterium]